VPKTNENLFQLYAKVQNGDREAIKNLIQLHKSKYPDHFFHKKGYTPPDRKMDLHTMYLHLT